MRYRIRNGLHTVHSNEPGFGDHIAGALLQSLGSNGNVELWNPFETLRINTTNSKTAMGGDCDQEYVQMTGLEVRNRIMLEACWEERKIKGQVNSAMRRSLHQFCSAFRTRAATTELPPRDGDPRACFLMDIGYKSGWYPLFIVVQSI